MNFSKKLLALTLLVASIVAVSNATPPDQWVKLGERHVNDKADKDTVMVTGLRGMFSAIKFSVSGHAVNFKKVVVHYRNGGKEEIELRSVIPAGGESRTIDLKAKERVINRIEFWYEAVSVGKAGATVKVFGKR